MTETSNDWVFCKIQRKSRFTFNVLKNFSISDSFMKLNNHCSPLSKVDDGTVISRLLNFFDILKSLKPSNLAKASVRTNPTVVVSWPSRIYPSATTAQQAKQSQETCAISCKCNCNYTIAIGFV